jgi:hypothetical protein
MLVRPRIAKGDNNRPIQAALTITMASFMLFFFTIHAHAATSVKLDQLKKDGYECLDFGPNKEQVKCSRTYYCLQSNGFCADKPID